MSKFSTSIQGKFSEKTGIPEDLFKLKGIIFVPADFPTLAEVQVGWSYIIGANVTDNDPTKTNTGQSFLAGDEIVWNGTNWTLLGATALWGDDLTNLFPINPRDINIPTGKIYKINNQNIFTRDNPELTTFNKGVFASINEINAFYNKIDKDISYYLNASATQTLTTSGAGDLATKIGTLVDGDILEIQVSASYSSIIIPSGKRFAIRVAEGYDVEINTTQGITLNNGATDVFLSGFIFDSNPGGDPNNKGSAICFQHQAIVNDITFHNCNLRNNGDSAVLLSYHQSIGGDNYIIANLLSEFSNRIAFVDCNFNKAANDPVEGGAITARGIKNILIKDCNFNGQDLSRCIHLQNNLDCFVINNKINRAGGAGNGEGIKVDKIGSPTYSNSGYVIYNEVKRCIEGIDIDDTVSAIVYGNKVCYCSAEGISLDDSSQGIFAGNITHNNYDGIRAELGSIINLKNNLSFANSNQDYRMDNAYVPDDSNSTNSIDAKDLETEIFESLYNGLQHPTGFPILTDSEVLYNPVSRQITIQPKAPATSFSYFLRGRKYTVSSAQSLTHPNTTGLFYFYWDSTNTLQFSSTSYDLLTNVLISYVQYNSSLIDGFEHEERHHSNRTPTDHLQNHEERGAYVVNLTTDFIASDYTISPVSPTDADNTFSLTSGTLADEDLRSALGALADGGPYTIFWRTGSGTEWIWDKTLTVPFKSGTYIQYNHVSAGNWILSDITNNQYVNIWVIKNPSLDSLFQTIIITPQNVHANLAAAQAEVFDNLNLAGLNILEGAAIYRFTYRASAAYTSTGKVRIEDVERLAGRSIRITQAGVIEHNATVGKQLAGSGVTWGHISDSIQTIYGNKDFASAAYLKWSSGATAQRPGSPVNGMVRYNTDINRNEFYENGSWENYLTESLENLWDRTGNTLIPHNAGDDVKLTGILYLHKTTAPALRMAEAASATDYSQIEDAGSYFKIYKKGDGALTVINIDPMSNTETDNAEVRFFENTDTTGGVILSGYVGDGTSIPTWFINSKTGLGTFFGGIDLVNRIFMILPTAIPAAETETIYIRNEGKAASMTDTQTSLAFYQTPFGGSSGINLGKLLFGTETDWTTTASTQDGYCKIQTVKDGILGTALTIDSNKDMTSSGFLRFDTLSSFSAPVPDKALQGVDTSNNYINWIISPDANYKDFRWSGAILGGSTADYATLDETGLLITGDITGSIITSTKVDPANGLAFILTPPTAGNEVGIGFNVNNKFIYNNAAGMGTYASGNILLMIDSNNDTNSGYVDIRKDSTTFTGGTGLMRIYENGYIGISKDSGFDGKVHIEQANATLASAVLALKQDDISEGFINFVGSDRGVIATSTTNSTGSVRVEMNGTIVTMPYYPDQ